MKNKIIGILVIFIIYALAFTGGYFFFNFLEGYLQNYLLSVLIVDAAMTIFVWLGGVIFKTASIYDPYWSVQTVLIYLALLFHFNNWNIYTIIPLVAIGIYSIRLTVNFLLNFHSLKYVDWRYSMLKEKSGKLFQLVNLFGICMFPTLIVYFASTPIFVYASLTTELYSSFDYIGSIVILLAVLLELVSDLQMRKFIKERKSREEVINIGLWKYSRHPNYLGEILVWYGIAMVLIIDNFTYWYWGFGAIAVTFLFAFISIPMEEKHMLTYKPALKEYIKTTHPLLILPRRKIKNESRSETN